MKLPEVMTSKKALVFAVVAAAVVFQERMHLSPEDVKNLVQVGMAYLVGQGFADIGKEKAKVETATL